MMVLRRLIGWAQSEVASVSSTPLPRNSDFPRLTEIVREPAPPTPVPESVWIERAQSGDAEAVEWLVRAHWDRVRRLIVRVVGPRQDLEDLVQNTFLEALRALPGFRRESALATFLCGIAMRVALRARRPPKITRASLPLEAIGELPGAHNDPDAALDRTEALRRVDGILERLSESKRVAFMLWALEGLRMEEVAEAMHASLAATRSRVFYAQKELKRAAARDPYLRRWLEEGALS
jgi:RNA polymerase sigma-70 factor (ECF subfamily)